MLNLEAGYKSPTSFYVCKLLLDIDPEDMNFSANIVGWLFHLVIMNCRKMGGVPNVQLETHIPKLSSSAFGKGKS